MTKFKKFGIVALAAVMTASACSLAACGNNDKPNDDNDTGIVEKELVVPKTFDFSEQVQASDWRLETDTAKGYTVSYYRTENVVYCTNPTNPEEQAMRFYVPSAYLNEDGTLNKTNVVNGYTSETAPIIYINNCSGYAGGEPWYMDTTFRYAGVNSKYYGWYYNYLNQGFVLIFVGERGKQTYDENKNVIGVCPTSLVDLKAGIRFLKYNSGKIPGDTDKIISNGVSAGGAMSSLIGVTGNSDIYNDYLKEIGAYMGEDADDSVFATQVYCPITDLDHAALAYEWTWQNDDSFTSDWTSAMSELMAKEYATYINGLELEDEDGNPLTANTDGTHGGSFYEWLMKQYEASYNHYVEINGDTDSSEYTWLSYDSSTKASITSLAQMIASGYNARQKACISFDTVTGAGGDNAVFGKPLAKDGSSDSWRHYTPDLPGLMKQLTEENPENEEFKTAYDNYYQSYYNDVTDPEVLKMIKFYNPYPFIQSNETDISQNFRICVGTQDRDTSPTVSAILALLLQQAGYDVEYNLMWNMPHIDADYAGEFEAWVNNLCKTAIDEE